MRDQKLWPRKNGRIVIFRCRRNLEYRTRRKLKVGMESANQIHIQALASCIVERKVFEHYYVPPIIIYYFASHTPFPSFGPFALHRCLFLPSSTCDPYLNTLTRPCFSWLATFAPCDPSLSFFFFSSVLAFIQLAPPSLDQHFHHF